MVYIPFHFRNSRCIPGESPGIHQEFVKWKLIKIDTIRVLRNLKQHFVFDQNVFIYDCLHICIDAYERARVRPLLVSVTVRTCHIFSSVLFTYRIPFHVWNASARSVFTTVVKRLHYQFEPYLCRCTTYEPRVMRINKDKF